MGNTRFLHKNGLDPQFGHVVMSNLTQLFRECHDAGLWHGKQLHGQAERLVPLLVGLRSTL